MWSQPEILLYALPPCEDLRCGIGYPDFIETAKGEIFLTETDKKDSRVHRLPPKMLEMMWKQSTLSERVTRGLTLELPNATAARRSLDRGNGSALPATVTAPPFGPNTAPSSPQSSLTVHRTFFISCTV